MRPTITVALALALFDVVSGADGPNDPGDTHAASATTTIATGSRGDDIQGMQYRVIETIYGPDIRFNDWEIAGARAIPCGGVLQLWPDPSLSATLRYYPLGATGGDVALHLRFQFTRAGPQSKFTVRFFRHAVHGEGITFAYHNNRIQVHYGGAEVLSRTMDAEQCYQSHNIRAITLGEKWALWFDDHLLTEGLSRKPGEECKEDVNEGSVIIEAEKIAVDLLEFSEQHIAVASLAPTWRRAGLLYQEEFGARSLHDLWEVYGQAPEADDGAFVFRFMGNSILRKRFAGPVAVDFRATGLAAPPQYTAGVTDAIFIWMLDNPEENLLDYLRRQPGPEYGNWTLSLPLYWMDFGGTNNVTTRLRRSPGRRLLRQFVDRARLLQRDTSYDITLVQNHNWVEYWVNDRPWIQLYDPSPLTEGYIGFRAYCADLKIEGLQVWQIE